MGAIDAEALVAFTQALVRVPSVNELSEGLGEGPAAALVAQQMRRFGWTPLVEEAAPDRPNVCAIIDGGHPGRTLLFEGHTDVVTEGDRAAWTHDPFGAEIEGGRIYGRGAADMKGGLAAMLFAAAAIARQPFPGRVIVAALADEEGMMLGAKDFVARGHAAGVDGAIICEPEGGEVCIAQKGALRVWVESRGRMAHGAMPEHGVNPIPAVAEFAAACRSMQQELQSEAGEHPLLGLPYLTPTMIRAGSPHQLNVIPDRAVLAVDIRTTPAVAHADLVSRLSAACGEGVELSVLEDRPSTETPPDHPLVQSVVEAHRRVSGCDPVLGGVPGATDGTILWRDAGVPVVTYGPGGKWIAHQADEYVELDDLVRAAEVYAEAARLFLSVGMDSSRVRV